MTEVFHVRHTISATRDFEARFACPVICHVHFLNFRVDKESENEASVKE